MNVDKREFQLTDLKGKPLKTKFEIKDKLKITEDYTILIKASVFTEQAFDNQDGTLNILYKLGVKDIEIIKKENEQ